MVRHIVFHADVDGIFGAALFLHKSLGDGMDNYVLHPALSSQRGDRFKERVIHMNLAPDDELVIIDYENHDRSTLWIDHHFNPRMGDKPVKTNNIYYDSSKDSAAGLVAEMLYGKKYSDDVSDLVLAADMIDRGKYPEIKYAFDSTDPAMLMRARIEHGFPAEMMFSRIVETLSDVDFDLVKANRRLDITEHDSNKLRADVDKVKRHIVIFNKISLIRQTRPSQFPRYAEYYLFPDIKYSVRASAISKTKLNIQIGFNKWQDEPNELNIGKFLMSLSYVRGGGHKDVGGANMDPEIFERFMDDLSIETHNEEEEMPQEEEMEKYAVDQTDPVEKKAEEMVKTGAAKNIDEAREKASEENEGKKANAGNDS